MTINWFDEDVYKLLLRLVINFVFLSIIIRGIYYRKTRRKDYLFTYYLIGFIIFFICFSLKKLDIDTGMGLGLFAIFSIIRYRTNQIEIKEMTYLFIVIGLSVINSLASNKISMTELGIINSFILTLTYIMENVWLLKHETRKSVVFENIKLIDMGKQDELRQELEKRTGLKIACLEEIAIKYNWISKEKVFDSVKNLKGEYYEYLKKISR